MGGLQAPHADNGTLLHVYPRIKRSCCSIHLHQMWCGAEADSALHQLHAQPFAGGKSPCLRALTFQAQSLVNCKCVQIDQEEEHHYHGGQQVLYFDAQKFFERDKRRVYNSKLVQDPPAPSGTCATCCQHGDDHLSPSRYCAKERHWLCCMCKDLGGKQSCVPCIRRVDAIKILQEKLLHAFSSDKFAAAMATVEEARYQAGPAFYHELAEIWKFALAIPSGIEFGEVPRVNKTMFRAIRMLLISHIFQRKMVKRIKLPFRKYMRKISPNVGCTISYCSSKWEIRTGVCQMQSLQNLCCRSCLNLLMPSPEIAALGGDVALRFLCDAVMRGILDERCVLYTERFVLHTICELKSGKTSAINPLTTTGPTQGVVVHYQEEHQEAVDRVAVLAVTTRTLGFERRKWSPECGLNIGFQIYGLGGHPVNWHFYKRVLARRAVYALIRRGRRLPRRFSLNFHELHSMVLDYIDELQLLVPGATVILVVLHVYCVMREQLDSQCLLVQIAVRNFLHTNSGASLNVGCIRLNGSSGAVDNLLHATMLREVASSKWYDRRPMLSSLAWLAEDIESCKQEAASLRLDWAEYVNLATMCGITEKKFQV